MEDLRPFFPTSLAFDTSVGILNRSTWVVAFDPFPRLQSKGKDSSVRLFAIEHSWWFFSMSPSVGCRFEFLIWIPRQRIHEEFFAFHFAFGACAL